MGHQGRAASARIWNEGSTARGQTRVYWPFLPALGCSQFIWTLKCCKESFALSWCFTVLGFWLEGQSSFLSLRLSKVPCRFEKAPWPETGTEGDLSFLLQLRYSFYRIRILNTEYFFSSIRLLRFHSVGKLTVKTGSKRPLLGKCS